MYSSFLHQNTFSGKLLVVQSVVRSLVPLTPPPATVFAAQQRTTSETQTTILSVTKKFHCCRGVSARRTRSTFVRPFRVTVVGYQLSSVYTVNVIAVLSYAFLLQSSQRFTVAAPRVTCHQTVEHICSRIFPRQSIEIQHFHLFFFTTRPVITAT